MSFVDENYTYGSLEGNHVIIKQQDILLVSVYEINTEYAFYLSFKGSVDKVFYAENNKCLFKNKKRDGVYQATFFNKKNGEKRSEKIMFTIIDGKFLQPEVISDTSDYKITFYNLKSEVTFIVFNGAGSNKDTPGFGLSYLLSKGYNVITCAQNNNQYQELSFDSFRELVTPYVKNQKVFLYGSSLGGYCAIYYAGAVNGTVIAGSPRNSLYPILKKVGKLTTDITELKHSELIRNNLTKKLIYILTDPHVEEDKIFIEKYISPGYTDNLMMFYVPFAGHEVLYHVNKINVLSFILDSIVNEQEIKDVDALFLRETEFTDYGRALYGYKNLIKYLDKLSKNKAKHPLIEKRHTWLSNKLK